MRNRRENSNHMGGDENAYLIPWYPSVGMFSWYAAQETLFASRRSTIVEMLKTDVRNTALTRS